ncbi:MAG: pyridoxal 5'-phosphate synthase glutaminase subunit PdxT, partial [candidate division Zixibacteria bacterium]|nr:pyridoxal 5'-phosphate synthase glutaminase subunit PdxT [candidate division Zixibacteria bacterium]
MSDNEKDSKIVVGVLAIQGDYEAHFKVLKKLDIHSREIRQSRDINFITHLIIPGGESTTIRKVAVADGYWDKLAGFKGPVMGTCMGSILMATDIENPTAKGWGMIDITVARNAYGRQVHSFTDYGSQEFSDKPCEMVFIRAPKFSR